MSNFLVWRSGVISRFYCFSSIPFSIASTHLKELSNGMV